MIHDGDQMMRDEAATAALAKEARADLGAMAHPNRSWVAASTDGDADIIDVAIVGGGQTGVITAASLARESVTRLRVLDRAGPGSEGPWTTFARMAELRTPKQLVGADFGIPSLSTQRWYEAAFGPGSWDSIERVPTKAWRAYLDWYADTVGVTIENDAVVQNIAPSTGSPEGTVSVFTNREEIRARVVVLATGFDGAGSWSVPKVVSDSLPADRFDHSNGPIDFTALEGARIGVLGHGASAFDNAATALELGAKSVDLCFRRARLPRVNPHRYLETAGPMTHYPELSDAARWRIAHHFRTNDQPPPKGSFARAMALPGFRLHPASPWESVALATDGPTGEIIVTTPHETFRFDHLILATGARTDLAARPELQTIAPAALTWADQYQPPAGLENDELAKLPYLDDEYGFLPRRPEDAWVNRVIAFNFASAVSHAPHSTSISGHKHCLPRMVRGVTKRLLRDSEDSVVQGLLDYYSDDLGVPDDFEHELIAQHLTEETG